MGRWQTEAYSSGWSHTIHFSSFAGLLDTMRTRHGLRGNVSRLGIVAHGDQDGQVQLERPLRPGSVSRFEGEWRRLRDYYLEPTAQLVFFSCIAGAGTEGSRLLVEISRRLPGRTIIGFTVSGETSASENLSALSAQTPGQVREAPHGRGSGRPGRAGLLVPHHVAAKWARNGAVVRIPPLERAPGNRCGNPECPGHALPIHFCEGWG